MWRGLALHLEPCISAFLGGLSHLSANNSGRAASPELRGWRRNSPVVEVGNICKVTKGF